ncbi:YcgJ family protein [Acinetobacter baumannii]|uniref:YcgJ family protein n=1 Tax=Acinetobacter baumannii TaxID=470 RepID=UPI0034D4E33B
MKNSNFFVVFIGYICFTFSENTFAKNTTAVFSHNRGVVCDKYICADKKGVSKTLTNQYLGAKKAKQAFSQGDFDTSAFTFSNGVFCDTTTKLCHVNKFFENGHRSRVDKKMTDKIFKNR